MLNRGEVEGRLEPKSFLLKYRVNDENISNSRFPKYQLRKISKLISDGTHFTPKYTEEGVKFLSVKDVRPFEINYDNSKFISIDEAEILDKRCKPQKGDILLTKIGTIGLASVIKSVERFQIFVSLALLRTDNELILPEYLALSINSDFTFLQFDRIIKGAGVPDLHLEDIRKVKIPVPPIEIQKQIVEKFEKAYAEKKTKEAEAREKLASVDKLVLDALGITLPDAEENTLARRIFFTKSSDISSGRFDSPFYRPYFKHFNQAILKSLCQPLKNIANFASEVWNQEDFFDLTFPYIEISGIKTQTGEIFEVSEIEKAEAPSRARLIVRKDDILVSTTRPNRGAITLLRPKHDFHIASTGFAVIRDVREVSKEYLLLLLRHQICLTQMEQRSSGGNYPAITLDELQNIQIPIPPPENQKEIAERVEAIYAEAKLLREQGVSILKHAKTEVERMILGES